MSACGYKPVGADFPVFLHPETGEEYALARTERKAGRGYHGFTIHAGPEVTLDEDLSRRDLRINAMAMDPQGAIHDPWGGQQDLQRKQLRHVTAAFAEDPLRVLRVARFAARLHAAGFMVAAETLALMRAISASGELEALTPERVWREIDRSLGGPDCAEFFRVLRAADALAALVPELDRQFGVPQPVKYHPEVDCGLHTLMALEQAERRGASSRVRFAVLCHDFGKGTTPAAILPSHRGHEQRGVPLIEAFCERYRVPRAHGELAALTAQYHLHAHRAHALRASTILELLDRFDVWRRPQRFEEFLQACEADACGRTGLEDAPYPQADYLRRACAQAAAVDARDLLDQGLSGKALGRGLRRERLRRLESFRSAQQHRNGHTQDQAPGDKGPAAT